MAYGGGDKLDISLPASADFSAKQYRFVSVDGDGQGTVSSSATTPILGILQNKPVAGQPMRIRTAGISKLSAGAALVENDQVISNAQGFGTAWSGIAGSVFVGAICLAAVGGSADLADVLVTRYNT